MAEKNTLITQGRLLRDKKPAKINTTEWFELYHRLTEQEELKGEQERIAANLAQELMAMQIASQLQASNSASV